MPRTKNLNSHPMQRLIDVPVVGPVPERDPEFGVVFDIISMVAWNRKDILEEEQFDSIQTTSEGYVHLMWKRNRVARVCLTSQHADAQLRVLDPMPRTGR